MVLPREVTLQQAWKILVEAVEVQMIGHLIRMGQKAAPV